MQFFILIAVFLSTIIAVCSSIYRRRAHIWLPSYLLQSVKPYPKLHENEYAHIIFCLVDHFEPCWNRVPYEIQQQRVDAWVKDYPKMAEKHIDADGKHPQHTWFYPQEEYEPEFLDKLSVLCRGGYGEVEFHLHHDNDTEEGLREKIERGKQQFSRHGALITAGENPRFVYGFIHGNWSLDNSRRDGKWCGVNNELQILAETGCYADFTLPSAPSDTQTKKINSIYYATDDPDHPKSHNTGVDVAANQQLEIKARSIIHNTLLPPPPVGDLMIIQGPLCLNWRKRKLFFLPSIENGSIDANNPPTEYRVDLWIKQHIHVKGRPNWIFVKVYTHGAQDKNCSTLLGVNGYLNMMYSYLEGKYNDGKDYQLHYVTAREMYNIIKAAEAGEGGNPNNYRDYVIPPYANRR